ncbi:MAG: hypothetical protein K0Q55_972 [Verrucomicrobia bacterium]|jgi:hypothetical protein|nr:hypothetical protein [Verrucomicrobiota bacterium]
MFNPVPTSIHDILNSTTQFAIPLYQRDYKWGEEEATELIEDLRNYDDITKECLFLGNIIFEKSKDQNTLVVDGQQRLTTILLLLVACRTHAKALDLIPLATKIQDKITFTDSTTAVSLGCRLIASDSIRDVFEHITKDNWDGKFPISIEKNGKKQQVKRQVNRLKPIYDYFLKVLTEFKQPEFTKFLGAIYHAYVIRIEIENEEEALTLFERTNARGLDLEISDLLKNHLFAKKVKGIEDSWKVILDNSSNTILRMLKYFYVAKRGYVLKPHLYKKLKGYGAEIGAEEFTKELADFSSFYHAAKNAEDTLTVQYFTEAGLPELFQHEHRPQIINSCLQGLREFGVIQYCPVAFAAIECLKRNGGQDSGADAKALIRLFEAFEKYHFINNAVCDRVGNEVERLYADYCLEFQESKDFRKTSQTLTNALRSKLASLEEFIAKFSEIKYEEGGNSLLFYIFDRFNNVGLHPEQGLRIYNPDPKLMRRNYTIEHFLPQKPEAELKVTSETKEAVDSIGNLLAIYFRDNSKLGNISPAKKIERLKGDMSKHVDNASYVKEFIATYGEKASAWNKEQIQIRTAAMAKNAYQTVWKIN